VNADSTWPTTSTPIPDAAAHYAARGWGVFPVRHKRPTVASWRDRATTPPPPDTVRAEARAVAASGLGLACGGPARLVVVDVDGDEGRASLAVLEADHGPLPPTLTQRTGRDGGGEHRVFTVPEGMPLPRNSAGTLGRGLDVRAEGGYVVVAPSVHESGRRYEWIDTREPAPLPPWLHERMMGEARVEPDRAAPSAAPDRHRRAKWAAAKLAGCVDEVRGAPQGARNARLNAAAYTCGRLAPAWLEPDEVRAGLLEAALAAGLGVDEARATIESGLAAGMRDPRDPDPHERATRPGLAKARPDEPEWVARMTRTREGALAKTAGNVAAILRHDPRWRGVLAFDERAYQAVFVAAPPFPTWRADETLPAQVIDHHAGDLSEWLEVEYGMPAAEPLCASTLQRVAREHPFDAVRDYLDALTWTGECLVDTWLTRFLGVADTTYTRAVGRAWLVSAVARVYRPGAKVDHALILEGPQGAGKSAALQVLAGRSEWFADSLPAVESKDAAEGIQRRWIVELAELTALRRAEVESMKAFLTRDTDRYRPAYGRVTVDRPRRCVFAGTTNDDAYLNDPSGARRFWPVRCGTIDLDGLRAAVDQLWAEAVVLFREGAQWWLDESTEAAAREVQASRATVDPWGDTVEAYLAERDEASVRELFSPDALDVPTRMLGARESKRIEAILRRLGWVAAGQVRRAGGIRERVWRRPLDVEAPEPEPIEAPPVVEAPAEPEAPDAELDDVNELEAVAAELAAERTPPPVSVVGLISPGPYIAGLGFTGDKRS
jgi:predicted P-loop ATPase